MNTITISPYVIPGLIRSAMPSYNRKVEMLEVVSKVAEEFGLPIPFVFSRLRLREYVTARQISMYIINKLIPSATLTSIGRFFDNDHTTVIHAIKTTNNLMYTDKDYNKLVTKLLNQF